MTIDRKSAPRLHVEAALAPGLELQASPEQAHYLGNVLRLGPGAGVLLFNGRDGEWAARIIEARRKRLTLEVADQRRPQTPAQDLHYLFAPLKHARLDYMVQKATELGVSLLQPVRTDRTTAERVNLDRMRANVVEAAEQCGVLNLPDVREPASLESVLAAWEPARRLIFCDEAAEAEGPVSRLAALDPGPLAVLVGPEGGFTADERRRLVSLPFVTPISLGPRVMRADTAAVAALALVDAVLGDWR